MKITQLKSLIKHGESEHLEFKNSTGSITSGMQTVCAFLNSKEGGTVIFGVKDDGRLIGQEVSDKTRKEIATELNKIDPYQKIDVYYVPVKDKYAIVFDVPAGNKAPYTYDGRPFTRNQSTTIRMLKEEYMLLHNTNNPEEWESLTSNDCTLKDLDHERIKQVIRKAVSEKRLNEEALDLSIPTMLKKLKLMVGNKLTNAAVVLFCKNEDKQFIQSNVKLARFKGTTKSEFSDEKMFTGNAFDLYDKAEHFLVFVVPRAAKIVSGQSERVETPAIPYSVLREALVNALVHRDYSFRGGSVYIAVYDDRVEVSNLGALPEGIELEELTKKHDSIPRNPLIAHVFYLCKKIERWGRGTLDMIRDLKAAGNPPPIFQESGRRFLVTLPFKEPMRTVIYEEAKEIDLSRLTDRQKEIIRALKEGPLKSSQITDKISTSLSERVLLLELAKLKKMNLIKSMGRTKSTLWALVD